MCTSQTFGQCQTFIGVVKHSMVLIYHVQHAIEPINLNWCHPAFRMQPYYQEVFGQCQIFMGVVKHSVVQMCHVQRVVEPINLNWYHPAFNK